MLCVTAYMVRSCRIVSLETNPPTLTQEGDNLASKSFSNRTNVGHSGRGTVLPAHDTADGRGHLEPHQVGRHSSDADLGSLSAV